MTISVSAGALAGGVLGYLLWSSGISFERGIASNDQSVRTADDVNPDATMEELSRLPGDAGWLVVALGLVDELGGGAQAIDEVAAALTRVRAQNFRIAAIEDMAEADPASAVELAITLRPATVQNIALLRVAEVLVRLEAGDALRHAATIPDRWQRDRYREHVFHLWASRDPAGVLGYLEQASVSAIVLSDDTLRTLASSDAERLLAVAQGLPADLRRTFEDAAVHALIASDRHQAYAYANDLPHSPDRDRLLEVIAVSHGQLSPTDALLQFLELTDPPPEAINNLLLTVASEDLMFALEAAARTRDYTDTSGLDRDRLSLLISSAMQYGMPDVAAAVDWIANHSDARVRNQLNGFTGGGVLSTWAEYDPEGALAWTLRNPSHVAVDVVEHLGSLLGASSPSLAEAGMAGLPSELRGYWVAGVAAGLAASSGLEASVEWLDAARGSPVYELALERVLIEASSSQPSAVADIIEEMLAADAADGLTRLHPELSATVAMNWAMQEPGAAGDWIAHIDGLDDRTRNLAMRVTVRQWSQRDLGAAESWAMRLPAGPVRDAALGALVAEGATAGTVDIRLLAEYSSDLARSEDIALSMSNFQNSDPELGRWLIAEYISSPELRENAQQRLEGQVGPAQRFIGGLWVQDDGRVVGEISRRPVPAILGR